MNFKCLESNTNNVAFGQCKQTGLGRIMLEDYVNVIRYRKRIISHWKFLMEELDPKYIIDELTEATLLGSDDWEYIYRRMRRYQVGYILTSIIRKIDGQDQFNRLLDVFRGTNGHIANRLENAVDDSPLNHVADEECSNQRQRLNSIRTYLEDVLDPKDHIDSFVQGYIFTLDDYEEFMRFEQNRRGGVCWFLDKVLEKLKIGSFNCLLKSLKEYENTQDGKTIMTAFYNELTCIDGVERCFEDTLEINIKATIPKESNIPTDEDLAVVRKLTLEVEGRNETETSRIEDNLLIASVSAEVNASLRCLKIRIEKCEKSSVIIHLESVTERQVISHQRFLTHDIDQIIDILFNSSNVKQILRPGKYTIKACYETGDKIKTEWETKSIDIIKSNRQLLEEEFDPLPLLNAFAKETVASSSVISQKRIKFWKTTFKRLNLQQFETRRGRTGKFLDVMEKADTCTPAEFYELMQGFANEHVVEVLANFLSNPKFEKANLCKRKTVNNWEIEVYVSDIHDDTAQWTYIREKTIPELMKVEEKLDEAIDHVRTIRRGRYVVVGIGILCVLSVPVTGGFSSLGLAGLGGLFTAGVLATLVMEFLVRNGALQNAQVQIDNDKKMTDYLRTQVAFYMTTDVDADVKRFAEKLDQSFPDAINVTMTSAIATFIVSVIERDVESVIKAKEKVSSFREELTEELEKVEQLQKQYRKRVTKVF